MGRVHTCPHQEGWFIVCRLPPPPPRLTCVLRNWKVMVAPSMGCICKWKSAFYLFFFNLWSVCLRFAWINQPFYPWWLCFRKWARKVGNLIWTLGGRDSVVPWLWDLVWIFVLHFPHLEGKPIPSLPVCQGGSEIQPRCLWNYFVNVKAGHHCGDWSF